MFIAFCVLSVLECKMPKVGVMFCSLIILTTYNRCWEGPKVPYIFTKWINGWMTGWFSATWVEQDQTEGCGVNTKRDAVKPEKERAWQGPWIKPEWSPRKANAEQQGCKRTAAERHSWEAEAKDQRQAKRSRTGVCRREAVSLPDDRHLPRAAQGQPHTLGLYSAVDTAHPLWTEKIPLEAVQVTSCVSIIPQ